jgi:hypothetical protein
MSDSAPRCKLAAILAADVVELLGNELNFGLQN